MNDHFPITPYNPEIYKVENPFCHNYVFSRKDLIRLEVSPKINKYAMHLFFRRTLVQINDGYVFYFKKDRHGHYFLLDAKPTKDVT